MELDPNGFNVIVGENGSGKTSLLEAIYMLSCGRSFRTSDLSQVIQNNQSEYVIFAEIANSERILHAGVSRSVDSVSQVKLDGGNAKIADIHRILPVRAITPLESSELINSGPKIRRDFLDWGLFHVKQSNWDDLKRFHKILKQRNAALKMRCPDQELNEWNFQFIEISKKIDVIRREYVHAWQFHLKQLLANIPIFKDFSLSYQSGWEEANSLEDILESNKAKERAVGYSLFGPHRADLVLRKKQWLAKEQYSRGQQKLLAVAMYLAQGAFLKQTLGKHPLYLIDDFSSELDPKSQKLLLDVLEIQRSQVVLTSLSPILDAPPAKCWRLDYKTTELFELVD